MPDDNSLFPPRISNLAPLAELLPEEIKPFKERAVNLVLGVEKAVISDQDSLDHATTLGVLIGDCIKEVDAAREARKAPFLADGRLVDSTFNGVIGMLATYDKSKVVGGPLFDLKAKVKAYMDEQQRIADVERRRLEEEARKQRELAEAAERQRQEAEARQRREQEESARRIREAEEAAHQSKNREAAAEAARQRQEAEALAAKQREESLRQEIAARRALDEAERLSQAAAATAPTPAKNSYGMSSSRRAVKKAVITDFNAALRHAVKIDRDSILAAVQQIYDRQVKAKVATLPGAEIKEESDVSFRG